MQARALQLVSKDDSQLSMGVQAAARALALFFGGFSLLNLLGNFLLPGFDANLCWIDLRVLPDALARMFLLVSGLCLVGFGVRLPRSTWRRRVTAVVLTLLAAAVFWNVAEFYALIVWREMKVSMPVPLSLFVFAAFLLILSVNVRKNDEVPARRKSFVRILALFLACVAGFPFAQMICFGKTDYRRPADVAVVFGARVYKDGRPSDALADRVKTACQLYHDGIVKKLIFSGGPGDGAITESESMRRMAIRLGVKADDILTDDAGLNTEATVMNTKPMFSRLHAQKVLVVSHFYHLSRIKLAYQRAGWEVYTVPAKESYFLRQMPYFVAREVAAFWVYYLRPLASLEAVGWIS